MITMGRQIVVDYQDLIDEHAAIARLSLELEELALLDDPDGHVARIQFLLRKLAKVVADHLRKEESFIYPGLTDAVVPDQATGLVRDFELMKRDWETYLERWQSEGALCAWARFGEETIATLRSVRERALAEIGLLYAVGLREGLITLRPPAAKKGATG